MVILKLFALSTCIWCKKMENHLNELGFEYDVVYVDQLTGAERAETLQQLAKYNEKKSFPTLIIDNKKAVIGFKPEEIRIALNK
jgi:glutaredoxin-like protein NrdH